MSLENPGQGSFTLFSHSGLNWHMDHRTATFKFASSTLPAATAIGFHGGKQICIYFFGRTGRI